MQKSDKTDSLFIEEHIQKQAMRFIRGENWKKLAQLESKPTDQQDLDQYASPQKEDHSPQELNKPDNSDTTNSQFTEKFFHRQFATFIHGKSWKKLVQLASKQPNQQDSGEKKDQ